jgi:hypothetical protein
MNAARRYRARYVVLIVTAVVVLAILGTLLSPGSFVRTFFAPVMPNPVASFPFDPSHKGNAIDTMFQVNEYRSYIVTLLLPFHSTEDLHRVYVILGTGTTDEPGYHLRLRLRVFKLADDASSETPVLDSVVNSIGYHAMWYDPGVPQQGTVSRAIINVNLHPGRYRIIADVLDDNAAFVGTPCRLAIEYYPNHQFVFIPSESTKPEGNN